MSDYRRHKKDKNFTTIDNCVFRDKTLSMKAKGLLTQIYSLPDNWEYSVKGLATLFKDGKEAVANALNELIEHGYIVRTQKVGENGQYEGYEYDIYETPQVAASEKPFTENPITDKPITGNQAQLNTNLLNTNILNTNNINSNPPISPRENVDREAMFEQFWKAYPSCKRKVDKQGCKRKFLKIENLEAIFPEIMASLEMWKREWAKEKNEYVPLTSKWINQQYWTVKDTRSEIEQKVDEAADKHFGDFLL